MKHILSKISICIILITMLYITGKEQVYKKGVIKWDIISYYSYLPGLFIYDDLTFSFIDKDPQMQKFICTEKTPENKRVLKMSSGLAILYAPFFFIAHAVAKLQPDMYAPNGFSMIYSLFLNLSDIFYTIIGFIFLRKILLKKFTDGIAALTLLGIYFGTNLYFYSLFEVMSHNYLFCLITIFLYVTIQWHEKPSLTYSLYLGLLLGLITLIRPVDTIIGSLWVFYGVWSIQTLKSKILLMWKLKYWVILIPLLTLSVFFIQMLYWKYSTGSWLYWSYTNEHFFWSHPYILKGLFGFRKGLYIYMPILFIASIGILYTYKYAKEFFTAFIILYSLFTYVILCWWCWWYGGGLSIRPMIDIYCIFGIGLATFLHILFQIKYTFVKIPFLIILCAISYYGYFINWQTYTGLLHYDSMTYSAWKIHFMQDKVQPGFYESLSSPDYESAQKYGHE